MWCKLLFWHNWGKWNDVVPEHETNKTKAPPRQWRRCKSCNKVKERDT